MSIEQYSSMLYRDRLIETRDFEETDEDGEPRIYYFEHAPHSRLAGYLACGRPQDGNVRFWDSDSRLRWYVQRNNIHPCHACRNSLVEDGRGNVEFLKDRFAEFE
jgi:hypothetical protein